MKKRTKQSGVSAKVLSVTAGGRVRVGGFTLTELLVAVGALGLLSIAVAQVFSLTSRTVAAGRRQSAINQAAAAMERQIRSDFEGMTRDGFLVIRNQTTTALNPTTPQVQIDPPFPVFLSANDPAPRVRRMDELLFFAKGNYTSKREPKGPGLEVKADTAMIYYGHGAGQLPGIDAFNPSAPQGSGWTTPVRLDDQNPISDASGQAIAPPLGFGTPFSPQRYASDWVLARREVLMTTPSAAIRVVPGYDPTFTQDGSGQIALQPSVDSIFKGDFTFAFAALQPGGRALSSGAVDIAGTSLAAVRQRILQADVTSGGFFGSFAPYADPQRMTIPTAGNTLYANYNPTLYLMQSKMISALPSYSDFYYRMRVEKVAPNLIGWGWADGRATDEQRADQLMVSSAAFLPRCSEFIVEWSFGIEDKPEPARRTPFDRFLGGNPAPPKSAPGITAPNSLIWHGLPRGAFQTDGTPLSVVAPYREYYDYDTPFGNPLTPANGAPYWTALRDRDYYSIPVTLRNGRQRIVPHVVRPELIEQTDFETGGAGYASVYYATFGYIDPTWRPETRLNRANGQPYLSYDANGNGRYDAADGDVKSVELTRDVRGDGNYDPDQGDQIQLNEPATVPWAWPKLIRVTFSIADPGNGEEPPIEQTFQVVLRVPEDRPKAGF